MLFIAPLVIGWSLIGRYNPIIAAGSFHTKSQYFVKAGIYPLTWSSFMIS
jgi:hypothetical protein